MVPNNVTSRDDLHLMSTGGTAEYGIKVYEAPAEEAIAQACIEEYPTSSY